MMNLYKLAKKDKYGTNRELYTRAVSEKEAINNFRWQIYINTKCSLGYIHIDPNDIEIVKNRSDDSYHQITLKEFFPEVFQYAKKIT